MSVSRRFHPSPTSGMEGEFSFAFPSSFFYFFFNLLYIFSLWLFRFLYIFIYISFSFSSLSPPFATPFSPGMERVLVFPSRPLFSFSRYYLYIFSLSYSLISLSLLLPSRRPFSPGRRRSTREAFKKKNTAT